MPAQIKLYRVTSSNAALVGTFTAQEFAAMLEAQLAALLDGNPLQIRIVQRTLTPAQADTAP